VAGEAVACADAEATGLEVAAGRPRAAVLEEPHPVSRRMAMTTGGTTFNQGLFWTFPAVANRGSDISISRTVRTPLCGRGYVSGTILGLKQGTTLTSRREPKGSTSADGFKLSVLFYLQRLEE
jgi:hypothetical protein